MSDNHKQKQVSLSGMAAGKNTPKKGGKKKRRLWWVILPILLIAVLLAVMLYAHGCKDDGPFLTARETIQYTVTADELASKVSYFALGVTGEKSTDRMDMVAVMCYDRKADKVSVMQLPVATYIGESGNFATATLGDVWGNPKALVWCDTCRKQVAAGETDGDKHATCGTKLTSRTGSAFTDFIKVFNQQYGLPIDNYVVISRNGLVKLIDAVGGVDVQLDATRTLDGIRYEKGVRTLTGKAAVQYAVVDGYQNTPDSDRARMLHQRQVFAGLLDRLSTRKVDELYNSDSAKEDVLSNVIFGRDIIRYDTSSFGKARLMGVSESKGESTKFALAMAEFVHDISRVEGEDFTFFMPTGVSQKRGTEMVYSVNKAQTIVLLNQYMNPYGLVLDNATVTVPELKTNLKDADATASTLDKIVARVQTTESGES